MARYDPSGTQGSTDAGVRVELPRSCDAIGMVLRDAYEQDLGVPDDMLVLLRRISARPATTRGC